MGEEYLALNRANWDERAAAHAASAFYGVERFVRDPTHLSSTVRFDASRLGDLAGLRALHLQCHLGTDTLSLARLGAEVTGLDFSPASLAEARRLAARTGTAVDFVESDVYEAAAALGGQRFDLVYTGVGALCWLPEVERWASVVAALLRPGGRLFLREAHPMLLALDEAERERLVVSYPYFERKEPLVVDEARTYTGTEAALTATVTHQWNHGLGEVVGALIGSGLAITALTEHESVFFEALPGQMVEGPDGEWRLADRPWRLAASYTLQAVADPPRSSPVSSGGRGPRSS